MPRRRILFLYAGLTLGVLLITVGTLQASGVLGGMVRDLARQYLNPELFQLAGANVDIPGGRVELRGLTLGDGSDSSSAAIDSIEIDVDPIGLDLRKIHVQGLHVHLRWTEDGLVYPSLDELFAAERPQGGDSDPLRYVRRLVVTDSTIRADLPSGQTVVLDRVSLETSPATDEGSTGDEIVLTGTARLDERFEVSIDATSSADASSFQLFVDVLDVPLTAIPDFLPNAGEAFDGWDRIGGTAKKITGWVLQQPGGELRWGAQVETDDLRGGYADVPYELRDAKAKVSFQSHNGGIARLQLQDLSIGGDLSVDIIARNLLSPTTSEPPRVDAEATIKDLLINEDLEGLLDRIPVARRIWRGLAPRGGRGTGRFTFGRAFPSDGSLPGERVAFDLDVTGTSIQLDGFELKNGRRVVRFPTRIEGVDGRIEVRPDEVVFRECGGKIAGGRVAVDGAITLENGRPSAFRVDILGKDVAFETEVRDALAELVPGAGAHWDTYAPRGKTDFEIRVRPPGPADGTAPVAVDVRILPVAASASWRGFPVRVDSIRGAIDIGREGVSFDLEGQRDGGPIAIHGRFIKPPFYAPRSVPEDALDSELWLRAESLRLGEEVRTALALLGRDPETPSDAPSQLEDIWTLLQPTGTVGCELTLWKDATAEVLESDIRVDLTDTEIELRTLPVPISDLRGPVFVHRTREGTRVDVSAVEGLIRHAGGEAPAKVVTQGTILVPDRGAIRMDVASLVRGLVLDDDLANALDTPDANGIKLFPRANWDLLAPRGSVDVLLRQTRNGETHGSDMKISLRGVESRLERLPYPLTDMYGEVRIVGSRTRFRDIRGRMASSVVECEEGEVYTDGDDTVIQAKVRTEDFPLDDAMANLMIGPIREAYLQRRLRGRTEIRDLDIELRIPQNPELMQVDLNGIFRPRGVSMVLGADVVDIAGVVTINEAHVDSVGGFVSGSIEDGRFSMIGHNVGGVSADFIADPYKLRLPRLAARLHSGTVHGLPDRDAVTYEFDGDGITRANLTWKTVYLGELLEAVGFEDVAYDGQLEGRVVLDELIGADIVNCRGEGRLRISEGNLGEVPIFSEIYKILRPRERPRFTEVSFDTKFGKKRLELRNLAIKSGLFTVTGSGQVDMGGNLKMLIGFPDLLQLPGWLLLPEVVAQIGGQVVQFQVFGNIRSPNARPTFGWNRTLPNGPSLKPIPARPLPRVREDF